VIRPGDAICNHQSSNEVLVEDDIVEYDDSVDHRQHQTRAQSRSVQPTKKLDINTARQPTVRDSSRTRNKINDGMSHIEKP
jgi:hypothetical protein